jgi:hypothetical protein
MGEDRGGHRQPAEDPRREPVDLDALVRATREFADALRMWGDPQYMPGSFTSSRHAPGDYARALLVQRLLILDRTINQKRRFSRVSRIDGKLHVVCIAFEAEVAARWIDRIVRYLFRKWQIGRRMADLSHGLSPDLIVERFRTADLPFDLEQVIGLERAADRIEAARRREREWFEESKRKQLEKEQVAGTKSGTPSKKQNNKDYVNSMVQLCLDENPGIRSPDIARMIKVSASEVRKSDAWKAFRSTREATPRSVATRPLNDGILACRVGRDPDPTRVVAARDLLERRLLEFASDTEKVTYYSSKREDQDEMLRALAEQEPELLDESEDATPFQERSGNVRSRSKKNGTL